MEASLSKARKVFRAWTAGRPSTKDRLLNPVKALAEVCALRDELENDMDKAGLQKSDVAATIIWQHTAAEKPQANTVEHGTETNILDLMHAGKYLPVTIGVIFNMIDHERREMYIWARPFTTGGDSLQVLEYFVSKLEPEKNPYFLN